MRFKLSSFAAAVLLLGGAAAPVFGAEAGKPAASAAPSVTPRPQTKLPTQTKASKQGASSKAAKSAKGASKLPELLKKVEKKYTEAGTLFAKFEQTNHSVVTGRDTKSSGDIAFKRPDKVRWQTLKPNPSLLVSDGKRFWFYTPPFDETEHGQLIERKTSEVQSRVAQSMLSGAFSSARDVKVEEVSPSQFHLNFKKGTAGTVESARIEVDPEKLEIHKVTLYNTDGNTSEIALSEIQLGKELADSTFVFVAPPGTDHVKP